MIFLKILFTLALSIGAASAMKTADWLYMLSDGVIKSNLFPLSFDDEILGNEAFVENQIYEGIYHIVGSQHIETKEAEIKDLVRNSIAYASGAVPEGTFGEIKYNFSEDVYKTSRMLGADYLCVMWEK